MNAPAAVTQRSSLKDHLESSLSSGAGADELMAVISTACAASHNAAWEALALVDQYYRRRRISPEVYRTLKAHVEELALGRPMGADRAPATAPGAAADAAASRPAPAAARASATAAAPRPERDHPVDVPPAGDARLAPDLREATGRHPAARHQPVAEASLSAPRPLGPPRAGMVLRGRYRLEARLDYGNGVVFQALDEFRKELPDEEQRVAIRFPSDAADAQREFFRAQHLSHPNIARVIEFDRDGDTAFYIMELQHGRLLRDVLKLADHLPVPQGDALAIVRDIAAALEHAQSRGVLHGRLDTSSVLLAQDGSVRVLNFGLPRRENEIVEAADDLVALCLIAYELLAGTPAYEGRSLGEARERGMRLRRPPGLHRRQWRALQRGLATSGKGRSVTIAQWLEDMEVKRAPVHAAAPVELLHVPRPPTWPRQLLLGGVLVLCTAALVVLAVNWQSLVNGPSRSAADKGAERMAPIAREAAQEVVAPAATPAPRPAPAAARAAAPATAVAPAPSAGRPDVPAAAPLPASASTRPAAAAAAGAAAGGAVAPDAGDSGANLLTFQAEAFTVAPGESAARIPVRRSGSTRGDVGFVWWTEGGSARAGDDFVSFGEQRELIPAGQKSVSLYVPLSGGSRAAESEFYVNISEPSGGARLGRITRLKVIIAADQ